MRTFRFTWETLETLGESAAANGVLKRAVESIQGYLERTETAEEQAMYLKQPHHGVLWAAWQKSGRG